MTGRSHTRSARRGAVCISTGRLFSVRGLTVALTVVACVLAVPRAAAGPGAFPRPVLPREKPRLEPERRSDRPLPPRSAIGLYLGYPSIAGLQVIAPIDGRFGLRNGFTGVPGYAGLWTPGFEVRFSETPGTYATGGFYTYGNLFFQRLLDDKRVERERGAEAGFGWRFALDDVRGIRWLLGVEAGGFWQAHSEWPLRPSVRLNWVAARR